MACNCIKSQETALTGKMIELNEGSQAADEVTIVAKAVDSNIGSYRTFSHVTGRFRKNGRVQKFDERLIHTYCPFCGKKYTDNE